MKVFGLFYVAFTRKHPGELLADEYMRAFRDGREYEAEKRAERTANLSAGTGRDRVFVEGMIAGVEACAEAGHAAQPSTDVDADKGRYWIGYADGVRDGRGTSGSTPVPRIPRQRRPHPHLEVVRS